ncbi:uncharacterized protein FTJAE_10166 [Fusarium tjaetaba]|uniref:Uncharacterized protein n=1 Tax=Fusarium tjaetaba TaxID=1567544 RepID=A0A8H5VKX7_9HYPO|nr:uncharacterized protein FTJAE_10166 [Fusarium tjaetaba]KAF5624754.1 hypothetical protein FTJAE_10166 [Fusarium tjaetaba]
MVPPPSSLHLAFTPEEAHPPPVPAPLRVLYLGYLTLTSPHLVSTIDIHINHSFPQKHTPPVFPSGQRHSPKIPGQGPPALHARQNQDPSSSLAHPDACKPYHLRRGQGTHHRKVQLCEPEIPFDKGR